MGLFKKRKNGGVDTSKNENTPVVEEDTKSAGKAKKKKADLLKVLDESVWESVREDFKANTQFVINDDEGTKYVGLLFDTNQIGGLAGKAAKNDEAKGSIIEAIRTGRIKTYIKNEMLMDDSFIIIPDLDTIDNMDEYQLLLGVKYVVCTVDPNGVVCTETVNGTDDEDDPELTVDFATIRDLINNKGDVMSLFPSKSNKPEETEEALDPDPVEVDDDFDDEPSDEEEIPELPEEDDDEFSDTMPDDVSDEELDGSYDEPSDENFESEDDDDNDNDGYTDSYDVDDESETPSDIDDEEDDDDEYSDITEETLQEYAVRKFYSEDLKLEVSTQPFDAQFLHGNAYLPFNEDRGSGWLNEYLSNIAKDANTRMERMHSENLFRMRERYMRIIQGHCETIVKQLAINDDTTQYGQMKAAIEKAREENIDNVSESISEKAARMQEMWDKKLDQVGKDAYNQAVQQYVDRYSSQHENNMSMLESREKDEIERDYQNSMRRMNEDRRIEASKMLDFAVNDTLQKMSELYLKVLREEKKEYIRLQNEMTRFIDDNRKDEKARIAAMAEENRQIKKANEVRKDYTAKIKAMSAEFDVKKTALQADIEKIKRSHQMEIDARESEWQERLDLEKKKADELQQQVDELLSKFADLDSKKKEEYESRINTLEQEKASWEEQMQHVIETHNRTNKLSIVLIVAILIASIGIGFMFGSLINVRNTSKIEQSKVYQQYQQEQTIQQDDTNANVDADNNK